LPSNAHRPSHAASPQNGTGRPDAATRPVPRGLGHDAVSRQLRGRPPVPNQQGLARRNPAGLQPNHGRTISPTRGQKLGHLADQLPPAGAPGIDPHRAAYRQRLAEIDHIRDEALRRGDLARLEDADRMEREVRARYGDERNIFARTTPPDVAQPVGPGYGRLTAEQARTLGREFGQANAERHRTGQPLPPLVPPDPAMPIGPGYGRLTGGRPRPAEPLPPPDAPPPVDPQPAPPTP
jgi:hypothetical protein